ncbi:LodA/GoxA family CTQ-dependent oxidase [Nocardia sp. NPDC051463]|uniref:LodA/GoxA family CTQ-dependent oxidase n=1 Tax=Nocardia sp. NPDC051463 TaxID=3154845 RepID=UPI00344D8F6A
MSTSDNVASDTGPSSGGPPRPSGLAAVSPPPAGTDTDPSHIAFARIHPGIGVARVGNSPDEFFLGPEAPGIPANPEGPFKDAHGRMKRQAVRFRLYGYNTAGKAVRELTTAEANIDWTVQLVNAKAAAETFEAPGAPRRQRNATIVDTPDNPTARMALVIDPGPRTVSGSDTGAAAPRFDTGSFLGEKVPLGELRTDEDGRLVVLGGFGTSRSVANAKIEQFANNDTWFDDTSDGPVTARAVLHDGREIPVTASSWVIVAPPDYAPAVGNIVTLYDVQVGITPATTPPTTISFTTDIYPILARAAGYRWVNLGANQFHGHGTGGDFLNPEALRVLSDNTATARTARMSVFQRLRDPNLRDAAARQASKRFMPPLSGDAGDASTGQPATFLALLPHQYAAMRRWADGDFDADWPGHEPTPRRFDQIPVTEQPAALDRAALEACAGGPFFPGIEMTYTSRDPSMYVQPHRLRPDLPPGELTKRMALPWQADFYYCQVHWWPAQRPDEVVTEAAFAEFVAALGDPTRTSDPQAATASPQPDIGDLPRTARPWARSLNDTATVADDEMVAGWSRLGVLRPRRLPDGRVVVVEGESTDTTPDSEASTIA